MPMTLQAKMAGNHEVLQKQCMISLQDTNDLLSYVNSEDVVVAHATVANFLLRYYEQFT